MHTHIGAGSRKHEKTTHAKTHADERSEHKHRTNNDFKYAHMDTMGEPLNIAETDERDTTPGSAAAGGLNNENKCKVTILENSRDQRARYHAG